jgi:hypothetical protein
MGTQKFPHPPVSKQGKGIFPGEGSQTIFGYRCTCTAEIFKNTPIHIFNIFENHNHTHSYIFVENSDPIIYFITIL